MLLFCLVPFAAVHGENTGIDSLAEKYAAIIDAQIEHNQLLETITDNESFVEPSPIPSPIPFPSPAPIGWGKSYVNDLASQINDQVEDLISERLTFLEKETGVNFQILTIYPPILQGVDIKAVDKNKSNVHQVYAALKIFAESIFRRSKLGTSVKNDGILLVVTHNYLAKEGQDDLVHALVPALSVGKGIDPDLVSRFFEEIVQPLTDAGIIDRSNSIVPWQKVYDACNENDYDQVFVKMAEGVYNLTPKTLTTYTYFLKDVPECTDEEYELLKRDERMQLQISSVFEHVEVKELARGGSRFYKLRIFIEKDAKWQEVEMVSIKEPLIKGGLYFAYYVGGQRLNWRNATVCGGPMPPGHYSEISPDMIEGNPDFDVIGGLIDIAGIGLSVFGLDALTDIIGTVYYSYKGDHVTASLYAFAIATPFVAGWALKGAVNLGKGVFKLAKGVANLVPDVKWVSGNLPDALKFIKEGGDQFVHFIAKENYYLKIDRQTGRLFFGDIKNGTVLGYYHGKQTAGIIDVDNFDNLVQKLEVVHGASGKSLIRLSNGVSIPLTPGKTTSVIGSYQSGTRLVIQEFSVLKNTDFGARLGGFQVLNVPDELYKPSTFWKKYNEKWLKQACDRGDDVKVISDAFDIELVLKNDELTGFGKEIEFMNKRKDYLFDELSKTYKKL